MKRYTLAIVCVILLASCTSKQKVDTILTGGTIYSLDSANTVAKAIAINQGKIVDYGTIEYIKTTYTAEEIINTEGKTVYPGFIDAHCHFSGYALDGYKCDLTGTGSYKEVLAKLIEYEKSNKLSWIYGRGWDQNDWEIKDWPTKKDLDSLFPNKPVILKRVDGHAILCNQKALDMAGISANAKVEAGKIIVTDGKPTGILIDNAMEPVEKIAGKLPEIESIRYLQKLQQECYSYGLTGVVDCGVTNDVIDILMKLYAENKLSINNILLLSSDSTTLAVYTPKGLVKNNNLKIAGIKVYGDGSLGSRGACLIKDYSDMPGHRGTIITPINKIDQIADLAKASNFQLCTHAIGDSTNRAILRLYGKKLLKTNDLRWRVEHAQVVDYQDIDMFKAYSIVPSVQPTHATSDAPWAGERLGTKRLPEAYAYKQLLAQNGWLPLGTDFPVEQINPINTFYAAVFRKDKNGKPENGFQKENALTREEALRGITIWAAKSVFLEKTKGSIEKGRDADLVIMDTDIMTAPEKEILKAKTIYTIVNGKIVYKAK